MKKALFLAPVFALAVALAAVSTSGASSEPAASPQSANAAESALIRCGRTRRVGFLGPFTGPAASLGAQQRRWVRFYVNR